MRLHAATLCHLIKRDHVPQEKEALAREVEHLNNTVFSKHFKAPSAWAEREVKYKMEKRDWDAESRKLREMLAKLEAENAAYRASNKTAEFEAQIQVRDLTWLPHKGREVCLGGRTFCSPLVCTPNKLLVDLSQCTHNVCWAGRGAEAMCVDNVQELKATVETKEAEKVAVQKQLHELQIQGRSGNAPPRDDHEAIQGIIGDMEAHGIGEPPHISAHTSQSLRSCMLAHGSADPWRIT